MIFRKAALHENKKAIRFINCPGRIRIPDRIGTVDRAAGKNMPEEPFFPDRIAVGIYGNIAADKGKFAKN